MTLQKIRRFTLIISMLLFPITIYYFSPYLIIMAAMRHIINGSFIVFSLMFILGLFFGRIWCGFFCPMSLNVTQLLQKGEIKSAECILCGECVKACTKNVLEYKITSKR